MSYVDIHKIAETGSNKKYEDRTMSEHLAIARTNRPDEWSMDEFVRLAVKFEEEFVKGRV